MVKPFDYVNDINYGKKNIMVDDVAEKDYNAFIVNRALSYFNDTVLYANEMNIHHSLDSKLQYKIIDSVGCEVSEIIYCQPGEDFSTKKIVLLLSKI